MKTLRERAQQHVSTNRVILVLLTTTVLMQAYIAYRQVVPAGAVAAVQDAPDGAVVELAGMPLQGSRDTRIVLVEFSDYECPFCKQHATGVGKDLIENYVSTGRIRYAFANNPLDIHGSAVLMARAAICAGEQGRYWDMHDLIFEKQDSARARATLSGLAAEISLDADAFAACLDEGTIPSERISSDLKTAAELGLTATPGFALGRFEGNVLRIYKLITGAQQLSSFESAIEELEEL